jgi:hypothetical protein
MTNNPTIDGVSRSTIEAIIGDMGTKAYVDAWKELRTLLDAPAVERQVPVPVAWMRFDEDQKAIFTRSKRNNSSEPLYAHPTAYRNIPAPELAALQSTIAQLEDKLNKAINLDFQRRETIARLEARVQELESGRGEPVCYQARHSAEEPWFFTDKPGYWEWRPLFTAPPAPVSMVLPERRTPEHYHARIGKCGAADMLAEEWNACLDATAALNGERK